MCNEMAPQGLVPSYNWCDFLVFYSRRNVSYSLHEDLFCQNEDRIKWKFDVAKWYLSKRDYIKLFPQQEVDWLTDHKKYECCSINGIDKVIAEGLDYNFLMHQICTWDPREYFSSSTQNVLFWPSLKPVWVHRLMIRRKEWYMAIDLFLPGINGLVHLRTNSSAAEAILEVSQFYSPEWREHRKERTNYDNNMMIIRLQKTLNAKHNRKCISKQWHCNAQWVLLMSSTGFPRA